MEAIDVVVVTRSGCSSERFLSIPGPSVFSDSWGIQYAHWNALLTFPSSMTINCREDVLALELVRMVPLNLFCTDTMACSSL